MRTAGRRTISIILLFIVSTMLIGIFICCDDKNEVVETQETKQYLLSQNEFDEINIAWGKYCQKTDSILTASRELMDEYFFGRYNGCIILMTSSIKTVYSKYSIAGYEFGHSGDLFAVYNSNIYSLKNAYESGLLTISDIKELSEIICGKE